MANQVDNPTKSIGEWQFWDGKRWTCRLCTPRHMLRFYYRPCLCGRLKRL